MLSRLMLSTALAIAVLTAPVAPLDLKAALTSKMSCSLRVSMDPCHGCPINSSQTNSSSSCCSVQSPCFNYYSTGADDFVAGMASVAFKSQADDRFTFRSQRPPVPPPRFQVA